MKMSKEKKEWVNQDHVIEEKIAEFIKQKPSARNKYLKEMIATLFKLVDEAGTNKDLDLVQTTLKELRKSLKIFAPFRDTLKVCIFGSARTKEDSPNYIMTEDFAKKIKFIQ